MTTTLLTPRSQGYIITSSTQPIESKHEYRVLVEPEA